MRKDKTYIIPFVGLSIGKHLYQYEIGDTFFEQIEYSEVKKGKIKVDLTLNKQSTMLLLDFSIKGEINIPCDRCNEDFNLPVKSKHQLVVKTGGEQVANTEDDMIFVSSTDSEIDISHCLYEYIILSLPIKRVHPDDAEGESTCDKEVMKKLRKYSIKEEKKNSSIDPRWEKLANLKLN